MAIIDLQEYESVFDECWNTYIIYPESLNDLANKIKEISKNHLRERCGIEEENGLSLLKTWTHYCHKYPCPHSLCNAEEGIAASYHGKTEATFTKGNGIFIELSTNKPILYLCSLFAHEETHNLLYKIFLDEKDHCEMNNPYHNDNPKEKELFRKSALQTMGVPDEVIKGYNLAECNDETWSDIIKICSKEYLENENYKYSESQSTWIEHIKRLTDLHYYSCKKIDEELGARFIEMLFLYPLRDIPFMQHMHDYFMKIVIPQLYAMTQNLHPSPAHITLDPYQKISNTIPSMVLSKIIQGKLVINSIKGENPLLFYCNYSLEKVKECLVVLKKHSEHIYVRALVLGCLVEQIDHTENEKNEICKLAIMDGYHSDPRSMYYALYRCINMGDELALKMSIEILNSDSTVRNDFMYRSITSFTSIQGDSPVVWAMNNLVNVTSYFSWNTKYISYFLECAMKRYIDTCNIVSMLEKYLHLQDGTALPMEDRVKKVTTAMGRQLSGKEVEEDVKEASINEMHQELVTKLRKVRNQEEPKQRGSSII